MKVGGSLSKIWDGDPFYLVHNRTTPFVKSTRRCKPYLTPRSMGDKALIQFERATAKCRRSGVLSWQNTNRFTGGYGVVGGLES